ncbi:transcriptional corepressor LEUNIG [Trifolium repens]|nr:transcriptional corepressor LEUNIG [Trifolium repens]
MINFHSFVMVVVHLRATGDVPILKQSKFKVGEIISRFENKGFYLKGLIQLKIMDFSLQLKTCSETVSKQIPISHLHACFDYPFTYLILLELGGRPPLCRRRLLMVKWPVIDHQCRIGANVKSGYSLRTFTGHSAYVMSLDFHPNKDDLICSCDGDDDLQPPLSYIALLYLKKKKMKKRRMRLKKPKVESTNEKQEESDVVQGKRESSQVSNDKIEETAI